MKKFLLFTIAALCCSTVGNSKQLSETDAKSVADNFFVAKSINGKNNIAVTPMKLAYKSLNSATGIEGAYYVFNRGLRNGYVVVAGDDLVTTPVLGYSENGSFHIDSIPDNMRYWLDEYQRQIEYLQEKGIQATPAQPKKWSTSVAPLLGETNWGQDDPYNLLCPTLSNGKHAAAGCVATAMAQIMYYWQWPKVGVGSHSYNWTYNNVSTTLSADFSKSEYQWDLMTPKYDKTSNENSRLAVAKLLSDIGISVNMNYNTSSGANTNSVLDAFLNYFNYDKHVHSLGRISFRSEDWEQKIKTELDEGRPVYYSGQSNYGGHAFVCDGYNQDGYFHFNWGWNGYADGYFLTTALDPTQERTDRVNEGYNIYQGITIGIQPPTQNSSPNGYFNMNNWSLNTKECSVGSTIKISLSDFWSVYSDTYNFDFALNLFQGEELVTSQLFVSNRSAAPRRLFGSYNVNFLFPITLADGEYRLYPQYKLHSEPDSKYQNMSVDIATPSYIKVVISGGKVKAEFVEMYNISCTSINTETKMIQDRDFRVNVTLQNNGEEEFWERFYVKVVDYNKKQFAISNKQMVLIPNGGSNCVEFEVPAISNIGYYLLVICDYNDNELANKSIFIQAPSTPNLNITQDLAPESTEMYYIDIKASAKIKNTGGYYNGYIELMIYADNSIQRRFYDYITLDTNEEILLSFKGAFEEAEIGKEYTMALRRYDVTNKSQIWGKQVKFTLVDTKSAINEVSTDESSAPVQYFNLQGVEVKIPEHGIFIRKQGNKVTKVIL